MRQRGFVLIRFEASNYRSIATGVEHSMVAVDRERMEEPFVPDLVTVEFYDILEANAVDIDLDDKLAGLPRPRAECGSTPRRWDGAF